MLTSGSRAGLEPRSGGKSVAVQPIVIRLMDTLPFSILDYRQSELAIVLFVCCPDCNLLVRDFVIESQQRLSRTFSFVAPNSYLLDKTFRRNHELVTSVKLQSNLILKIIVGAERV